MPTRVLCILFCVFSGVVFSSEGFTGFCFPEPSVQLPNRTISDRVNRLVSDSWNNADFFDVNLLKAVITHESGGKIRAISPSGCAGIGAICHKPFSPCCSQEPNESGRYQKCDNELQSGYLCSLQEDPRFDPEFSVNYMDGYFKEIMAWAGVSQPDLVAMGYNAGPEFLKKLIRSAEGSHERAVLLQHIHLGAQGYRSPSAQYQVRKMIEIYDYVSWIDALMAYWQFENRPSIGNTASLALERLWMMLPKKYICFTKGRNKWSIGRFDGHEESGFCDKPEMLQAYRLEFGKYRSESVAWCKP